MTIEAGARLGPYQIVSQIGAGGMGEVYRAIGWTSRATSSRSTSACRPHFLRGDVRPAAKGGNQ
jgi:hypothetical protein